MANAVDIQGSVFKNGSATLLARVVGANGAAIKVADLDSAKYTIYELDESDPDAGTAVTGHTDVDIAPVSSLIFDTLQTDDLWDIDEDGYNFKHVVDITANPAFPKAGKNYRVVFTLTPNAGQPILVRFRLHAI